MDLERKLRKPKKEAQKIIVIFFGICTGFALWVTFDMPPDEEVDGNAEHPKGSLGQWSFLQHWMIIKRKQAKPKMRI